MGTKLPEVSMINTQIFKDHASVQNTSSKILLFKANDIKTKAAASSTKPKLDSKIKEQALETSRLECIQNFKKLKALEDMLHVPAKRNEFLRLARKIMRRFDSKSGEPIISKQGPIVGLIPATEIIPNISMDDWYHVFIQFALNATRAGNEEEAQIALNRIVIAKQLEEDFSKVCRLRLLMVAIAVFAGNSYRISQNCRWFCNDTSSPDGYRMILAMNSSLSFV